MFGNMIKQLKEGEMPSLEYLSALLKVALIKKQGVLQQPPACWSNDPKINPDATQLLWAAALIGHEDEIHAAAGIMINEMISRPGKSESGQEFGAVNEKLMEMVKLAPTANFAELLQKKADQARRKISASTA